MKVLHIEDNPLDADLIGHSLHREWPECEIEVVFTQPGCKAALQRGGHDLILSDFRLVKFSGLEALELAREYQPNTPFFYFSGSIQADVATEAIKRGAAGYVSKDSPNLLVPALRQAINTARENAAKPGAKRQPIDHGAIIAQAKTAVAITTPDLTIVGWNKGAEDLFGWEAEDAIGEKLTYLLNDAATGGPSLEQTNEWRGEVAITNRYGKALTVDVHITQVLDKAGQPNGRVHVFADVTLIHSLRNQFFRAQRLECLGLLAAGVAHDLNNVLSPLLVIPALMREIPLQPEHERLLGLLELSTERGAHLVKQIVRFAGGNEHGHEPIALTFLLNELVDFIRETFPRSIWVEQRVAENLPIVSGDPTRVYQVLMNLCINARDALPDGGLITLSAEKVTLSSPPEKTTGAARAGDWLKIGVKDNGVGIPPDVLDRIWEPFFTTKSGEGGTGLGLSTVKGIVQEQQGFITVESTPGVGSLFCVYLPCEAAANASTAAA